MSSHKSQAIKKRMFAVGKIDKNPGSDHRIATSKHVTKDGDVRLKVGMGSKKNSDALRNMSRQD